MIEKNKHIAVVTIRQDMITTLQYLIYGYDQSPLYVTSFQTF